MSGREAPQKYHLVSRAVGGVGERIGRGGGSARIILHARSFLESLCCRSFSSPRSAPAASATPTFSTFVFRPRPTLQWWYARTAGEEESRFAPMGNGRGCTARCGSSVGM
jgi:hypothetical protein